MVMFKQVGSLEILAFVCVSGGGYEVENIAVFDPIIFV